jgi:hypothetical protein
MCSNLPWIRFEDGKMRQHAVTVGFLIAAAALYIVGAAIAATILVVLGMLAEGVFWVRLIRGRRSNTASK